MIFYIILPIILFALWKIIFLPYIRLLRFDRQGIKTYFFPIIGKYFYCLLDAISYKDFYFGDKQIVSNEPKIKGYAYNLGSRVCLHFSDPELIKELQEKETVFTKDNEILEYLFTLIGKGLVQQTGERWSSHRKIISKSLHFDQLRSMVPVIQQLARKNFEKLSFDSLSNEIEIFNAFQNITSGVIMKLFFNENIEELLINGNPIEKELGEIVNQVGSELIGIWNILFGSNFLKKGYLPRHNSLNKRIKNFKKYCQSIVQMRITMKARNDYTPRNDLLDSFIDSGAYDQDEIVDELITFFLAGFETSSHALETVVFLLDIHKEWKQKILKKRGSTESPRDLTYEDVSELDDLAFFVKESFRFIPPVTGTVHRISDQDIVIGGYKIPKLTKIRADMIYNHFNPDYYEKPLNFEPERWRDAKCPKNPFGFMPFGYGARKCVGSTLAILEIKVILYEFVKTFEFEIADDYQCKFTLTTFYGLSERLRLKLRRKEI